MAENDNKQLAPCPFCGGKAFIARDSFDINYHVYCTLCKARTRTETACSYCKLDECKKLSTGCINAKTKAQELAVLAWQKRHGERPKKENDTAEFNLLHELFSYSCNGVDCLLKAMDSLSDMKGEKQNHVNE